MSYYVSNDHFGLLRLGKKRAFVVYLPADDRPVDSMNTLGVDVAIHEDVPTRQTVIHVHRLAITTFGCLEQADAEAAGYLYLHQLQEDLRKRHPEIEDFSLVQLAYFDRTNQ